MGVGRCRRCGGEIIGKTQQSRVCIECSEERAKKSAADWAERNPRTVYFRQYHLNHREKKNKQSSIYMANINPAVRRAVNRTWRAKNAYAIKVKRVLRLKTLAEARAMLKPKEKSCDTEERFR